MQDERAFNNLLKGNLNNTTPQPIGEQIVRCERATTQQLQCDIILQAHQVQNGNGADYVVVIGERIHLTAISNSTIQSVRWAIDGGPLIRNYQQDINIGRIDFIDDNDLRQNPIAFYWKEMGTYSVRCGIATAAGNRLVTKTVRVEAPDIQMCDATGGNNVAVGPIPQINMALYCTNNQRQYGHGIEISADVDAPIGFDGQLAFIQLINSRRRYWINDGRLQIRSCLNNWTLDDGVTRTMLCHGQVVPLQNGQQMVQISTNDGPAQELANPLSHCHIIEHFSTFLVYKPTGQDSIWIPIQQIDWDWEAEVDLVGHQWTLIQSNPPPRNINCQPPQVFPMWTGNIHQVPLLDAQ